MASNIIQAATSHDALFPVQTRPRLLVVDDQPANIQVLYQILSSDYQVFMATSGAQALALCAARQPDLVLLDLIMPDMDGYQVCQRLKEDAVTRDIPVIFITAQTDESAEEMGFDLGAVDFISKPINPRIVKARVKTHLMLKAQSDLLRSWAYLDGLTGVHNRRFFDERVNAEMGRAIRNQTPLSLVMLDVDFFKRFNDHYGHQAGDDCLRRVAGTLKNSLMRGGDHVARYGGEEFVCLLPDTDFAGAMRSIFRCALCHRQPWYRLQTRPLTRQRDELDQLGRYPTLQGQRAWPSSLLWRGTRGLIFGVDAHILAS